MNGTFSVEMIAFTNYDCSATIEIQVKQKDIFKIWANDEYLGVVTPTEEELQMRPEQRAEWVAKGIWARLVEYHAAKEEDTRGHALINEFVAMVI